jgi:glycogen operon protein
MAIPFATRAGQYLPSGAHAEADGINFSLFARDATAVELRLFQAADDDAPFQVIALDPEVRRTFFFWHVYVQGLEPGVHYTWRVAGPGRSLDGAPELVDPWARAVSDARWNRKLASEHPTLGRSLRAIVTSPPDQAPDALRAAWDLSNAVIYELHVGGFTCHPSSDASHPGTFAALIDKIPYLKELGVTHVELLPVMAFDEQDVPPAVAARGLKNYWGYNTYGFYAPHPHYCIDPAWAVDEFRDCVQALHEAGIGVLLDVVFNHTAEGGANGPTINFKAISDRTFYHHDESGYRDYTGCGNTVNCNHPLVSSFILHCLEYWADDLGVDGFRFDLASVFARGEDGAVLANPPLPWNIELSRSLVERPLIAEAWDAAGLYHVGGFPGMRWAEWNGRYRDLMRRFVRGEPGLIGEVATRLAGSSDLYADDRRLPGNSINFITCHDGFTLWDLLSYNGKHNEANGEDNRDGSNDNLSWNCGAEGATDDPDVLALRRRQARNCLAILMLSQGVPMLLAGDEVLRTQQGNNNAYCQDNELSWFDWTLVESNRDMLRFTRELIALRRRHPCLTRKRFFTGALVRERGLPDIVWHGAQLNAPAWHDPQARLLACTISGLSPDEEDLHLVFNLSEQAVDAELPEISGRRWHLALDTALASPRDIAPRDLQQPIEAERYTVWPRSVVALEAR